MWLRGTDPFFFFRLRDILVNNLLYFPTRLGFNDPFDCRIPVSWKDFTQDEWRQKLLEIYKSSPPRPAGWDGSVAEFVEELLKMDAIASLEKEGHQVTEAALDNFHVLCLCERPDDILMWSHYGGCHGGICLEFQTLDGTFFTNAVPVEYPEDGSFPKLKATMSTKELADGLIRTKAKAWAYEREWRIFSVNAPTSYYFQPECLSGVVLGCQIQPKHEALINEWLSTRNSCGRR
jgi:hypothetical protein